MLINEDELEETLSLDRVEDRQKRRNNVIRKRQSEDIPRRKRGNKVLKKHSQGPSILRPHYGGGRRGTNGRRSNDRHEGIKRR